MLKELRKEFNKVFGSNNVKEAEMVEEQGQPELAAVEQTADLAAQASALMELKEQHESLSANFKELSTKYAEAQTALAQLSEVKEAMVAQAAATELARRKESLEHAVGTVKAASLLATLEVLDNAKFDSVVSAMTVNLDAEASSTAFKETGVVAEADKAEVDPVKALADSFATKFKSK